MAGQTPLPSTSQMGGDPNGHQKRKQEVERLLDEFDARTGKTPKPRDIPEIKKKAPEPEKEGPNFYKTTPEMEAKQEEYDRALKGDRSKGPGTWQTAPVSKKERLLAWHKSIGSPQHVIDAELKQLEEQEARKK
ncbi:MAG: hypothetical protein ACE14P_06235 [Methanotrichaceae archaeon]